MNTQRLKKFMVHLWAFRIILLRRHKKFRCVIIFLSGKQLKIPAGNVTDIAWDGNDPPNDRLKTGWAGDSWTRTRLMDSLICITCSLGNNAFSALHYIMVTLHYSMLPRFEIFGCFWKVLSLTRFSNDLYTLYKWLNASRLVRFWKTWKHVNQGKTQHWALLITVICEASFTKTVIKPKYVDRFSSTFFRAASDQCTIKFPNFMSILKTFKVV